LLRLLRLRTVLTVGYFTVPHHTCPRFCRGLPVTRYVRITFCVTFAGYGYPVTRLFTHVVRTHWLLPFTRWLPVTLPVYALRLRYVANTTFGLPVVPRVSPRGYCCVTPGFRWLPLPCCHLPTGLHLRVTFVTFCRYTFGYRVLLRYIRAVPHFVTALPTILDLHFTAYGCTVDVGRLRHWLRCTTCGLRAVPLFLPLVAVLRCYVVTVTLLPFAVVPFRGSLPPALRLLHRCGLHHCRIRLPAIFWFTPFGWLYTHGCLITVPPHVRCRGTVTALVAWLRCRAVTYLLPRSPCVLPRSGYRCFTLHTHYHRYTLLPPGYVRLRCHVFFSFAFYAG